MEKLITLKTDKKERANHKDRFCNENSCFTGISQEKRQTGWVQDHSSFGYSIWQIWHVFENVPDVEIEAEEEEEEDDDVEGKIL